MPTVSIEEANMKTNTTMKLRFASKATSGRPGAVNGCDDRDERWAFATRNRWRLLLSEHRERMAGRFARPKTQTA